MIHSVPKPAPTVKTPKPLRRTSSLSKGPRKALAKINVDRTRKVATQRAQRFSSPEYKAARATAVTRAGGRCEARHVFDRSMRLIAVLLPNDPVPSDAVAVVRCFVTSEQASLEFHETQYASTLGIIREAKGCMLCGGDHQYIEQTRHSTRAPRRKAAA